MWCSTCRVNKRKKMRILSIIISLVSLLMSVSCSGKGNATSEAAAQESTAFAERGAFSADSAYSYVERQVAFGPRVPGSDAHKACSQWLVEQLGQWADTVAVMGSPVKAWDGSMLPVRNIFARFNPESTTRLLLLAHYDTRPWADHDPDEDARMLPFDGANDGASGVGILLEIARNLAKERPETGVDILLTDVEDYGARNDTQLAGEEDTWCLGSQQFVQNLPYTPVNAPRMGILLDMVGGKNAKFPQEYFSARYAQKPTAKVWAMAKKLGLSSRFPTSQGGSINDDHLPMIRAGIPTTDIIESANPATGSFNPTWHTHADNMDNIDKTTLGDVGRVVLNVIYSEKP